MKRKSKTEDFLVLVGVFVPILAVEKKKLKRIQISSEKFNSPSRNVFGSIAFLDVIIENFTWGAA